MTSGIQSKGVDLDSIFAAYVSGTHPTATGLKVNGVDIATRYQPLPGTSAAATGIKTNGADLNTLFSTTASGGPLPINGNTYTQSNFISSGTGYAQIGFGITSTTAWRVFGGNSGAAPGTLASGAIPVGAATVKFTWGPPTFPTGTGAGGSTVNGATTPTALSSLPGATYTTDTVGSTSASRISQYPFTIDFYNSSGSNISSTLIYLAGHVEGSV